MNSSDGIKESISLIICFKIREDSIVKCSKLLDDLLKYCFTKTISETNNTTNIFHESQKMQRKTGSAQQKMHRTCFIMRILIVNLIFSSICTNQAPAFQQTCLYLRRNSATVSMLSVTGHPRGYAEFCGFPSE